MPILDECTKSLREAGATALTDLITYLLDINKSRWGALPKDSKPIADREANLKHLDTTLAEFRASKHFEILEPFRDLFDDMGNVRGDPVTFDELPASRSYSVRELFRCYVFTTSLISFSIVLVELLQVCLDVERANPKNRFQLPTKFSKMLIRNANEQSGGNPLDMGVKAEHHAEDSEASSQLTLVGNPNEKEKAGRPDEAQKHLEHGHKAFSGWSTLRFETDVIREGS